MRNTKRNLEMIKSAIEDQQTLCWIDGWSGSEDGFRHSKGAVLVSIDQDDTTGGDQSDYQGALVISQMIGQRDSESSVYNSIGNAIAELNSGVTAKTIDSLHKPMQIGPLEMALSTEDCTYDVSVSAQLWHFDSASLSGSIGEAVERACFSLSQRLNERTLVKDRFAEETRKESVDLGVGFDGLTRAITVVSTVRIDALDHSTGQIDSMQADKFAKVCVGQLPGKTIDNCGVVLAAVAPASWTSGGGRKRKVIEQDYLTTVTVMLRLEEWFSKSQLDRIYRRA
jgi:hypothetical protein